MTDAYAAYLYFNKLKDCTHVCCWSHVRRIFVSASRDYSDSLADEFIELIGYVKIGSVLIDNNCCERAVRPFTNLRKSFGGFSSERGAKVAATYLTFVETCKLMVKAPLDFFRRFFDMIIDGRRDYALMTEALLVKPV